MGDRTENINRAALYDRLIKKGHSHADASFMARDLMDFSMGGSAPIVRFLTQSVPFLNARMQGLYKLGRAAKEDPRRFATVAMAVSVASLGLLAAYADDEDWKRREDWDRDSYWWFKVGDTAFRIPKPFEVGAIGTLAERTAEAMFSDEMDSQRFMERISHMVSQTFAFDPIPQAVKPLLDIYSNKDSFTGRAIESQADQRLRPQDRYNEKTSEVARCRQVAAGTCLPCMNSPELWSRPLLLIVMRWPQATALLPQRLWRVMATRFAAALLWRRLPSCLHNSTRNPSVLKQTSTSMGAKSGSA